VQPIRKLADNAVIEIAFAGETIALDGRGVAFLPAQGALIVADLHLEKGSRFAAMRRPVPTLDTHDTLTRLRVCVGDWRPHTVICLGDSFHDARAGLRLAPEDRKALDDLCGLAGRWIWLSGNHDPRPPEGLRGEALDSLSIGALRLTHIPTPGTEPQIAGHMHPKTHVSAARRKISGPCFVRGLRLLILPAFGAYTGGLSCKSPAMAAFFPDETPLCYMMFQEKLFQIM